MSDIRYISGYRFNHTVAPAVSNSVIILSTVPPSMHQVNTVAVVNPSTALRGANKIADMLKNMKKEKKSSRSRSRSRDRSRTSEVKKEPKESKLGVLDDGTGNMIQLSGGAQRNILMQKLMRSQRTKVICLRK